MTVPTTPTRSHRDDDLERLRAELEEQKRAAEEWHQRWLNLSATMTPNPRSPELVERCAFAFIDYCDEHGWLSDIRGSIRAALDAAAGERDAEIARLREALENARPWVKLASGLIYGETQQRSDACLDAIDDALGLEKEPDLRCPVEGKNGWELWARCILDAGHDGEHKSGGNMGYITPATPTQEPTT